MSRSINALVGIIGAIAGIVSALVGLIQVGLVEAPEPDRSAAISEPAASYRPSPRVREDFEPITIEDDHGRIRRTDLDRLPLPRAPLPPLACLRTSEICPKPLNPQRCCASGSSGTTGGLSMSFSNR